MGGGSLMTPILVIVFGVKPSLAIGTDILHGAIFKTVGAIRHRRLGNVQARLSGWMFLGSDILHAAALLSVAGFGHFVAGNVDMHIVAWLLLGSIPGVLIGSQWMVRLPETMIRASLAVVLLLSGLKLVELPGTNVTIAAGLGGGALILTAFAWRDRTRRQRARTEQQRLAAERTEVAI